MFSQQSECLKEKVVSVTFYSLTVLILLQQHIPNSSENLNLV